MLDGGIIADEAPLDPGNGMFPEKGTMTAEEKQRNLSSRSSGTVEDYGSCSIILKVE